MKFSCIGAPKCMKTFKFAAAQKAHINSCPVAQKLMTEKQSIFEYEELISTGKKTKDFTKGLTSTDEHDYTNNTNGNESEDDIFIPFPSSYRNANFTFYPALASRGSTRESRGSNLTAIPPSSRESRGSNFEAFRYIASRNELKAAQSIGSSASNFSTSTTSHKSVSPISYLKFSSYYRKGLDNIVRLNWNDSNRY